MSNGQKYTYSTVFHKPEGPLQALRQQVTIVFHVSLRIR
jgi:hypothetical protein